MNIKIDKADRTFSQYIRLRDGKCQRCYSKVELNEKGLPASHQNSHYFSRGREGTRFDPDNCITLCMACHMLWGGDERDRYKDFMILRLGVEGFKRLDMKAHTLVKKDRKMAYLISKQLLKELST